MTPAVNWNPLHRAWKALPASWRTSLMGRCLRDGYGRLADTRDALVLRCALLAHTARLALVAAGLLRPQVLVVRCMVGAQTSGLFAEFATVLGALEHYDRWSRHYAGLRVDYATDGLYYDPSSGLNWWQYYFEPINLGGDGAICEAGPLLRDRFAVRGERLSRRRGFEIIDRYIRPRQHVLKKVEAHAREHFSGAFVVGVHYRGTDKHEEADAVSYEQVRTAIAEILASAGPASYRLFLATDEQAFLDYMVAAFPGVLSYRAMFRSRDGRPIDVVNPDTNYTKGEDAVIDCLLLARADVLIRTASNLSLCSTYFQPAMPVVAINHER